MAVLKTFFEQIPIETVKRIAKESPEDNAIGINSENTETPDEARSPPRAGVQWHKRSNTSRIQRE